MNESPPEGVDPDEFNRLVQRLSRTMPRRNAILAARREFMTTEERHAGLRGKALARVKAGEPLTEQIRQEREKMAKADAKNATENGDGTTRRGRSADPNSDRSRALAAAVAVLKAQKGKPLARKDIDAKVATKLKKNPLKTKQSVAGMVNDAQAAGREIDGFRFTRPERGKYQVEKVA